MVEGIARAVRGAGGRALVVGGWVRDQLMGPSTPLGAGHASKDVDIEYRQCKPNGKPAPGSWNTVTMSYENYDWSIDSIENVWHPLWIEYKGGWSRPWWF